MNLSFNRKDGRCGSQGAAVCLPAVASAKAGAAAEIQTRRLGSRSSLSAFHLIVQPKVLYASRMLNEDSVTELKRSLRGTLIQPRDADYDEARKVYNGMIHKKPRLIARCADVADVMRSVNFARDNDLLVSIRGGG